MIKTSEKVAEVLPWEVERESHVCVCMCKNVNVRLCVCTCMFVVLALFYITCRAEVNHHHTSPAVLVSFSFTCLKHLHQFPNGKLLDTCCFAVQQRLTSISLENDFAAVAAVQFNMAASFRLFLCAVKTSEAWLMRNLIVIYICSPACNYCGC